MYFPYSYFRDSLKKLSTSTLRGGFISQHLNSASNRLQYRVFFLGHKTSYFHHLWMAESPETVQQRITVVDNFRLHTHTSQSALLKLTAISFEKENPAVHVWETSETCDKKNVFSLCEWGISWLLFAHRKALRFNFLKSFVQDLMVRSSNEGMASLKSLKVVVLSARI